MSEIYKLTNIELEDINNVLIKHSKLNDGDPCFCGKQTLFSECCKQKANFWIPDDFVESLVRFTQSQNWKVSKIPFLVGKNNFEDYYL